MTGTTTQRASDRPSSAYTERRFVRPHRWPEIWCSSCGEGFGPGNFGFSHCENHDGLEPVDD